MTKEHITYLNPQSRPKKINKQIQNRYNKVSKNSFDPYYLDNNELAITESRTQVNEKYILYHLIKERYSYQKEFYFLDLGTGNFEKRLDIANFINTKINYSTLSEIKVNMVLVREEINNNDVYHELDNCRIWMLGGFKVEHLIQDLKNNQLGRMIGRFDLIISNHALNNLVDPIGTLIQMYECLNIDKMMIFDTFYFTLKYKKSLYKQDAINLLSYLCEKGDQAIIRETDYSLSSDGRPVIVLKKSNAKLELPFKYYTCNHHYASTNEGRQEWYEEILKSKTPPLKISAKVMSYITNLSNKGNFVGDRQLFQELIPASLLIEANDDKDMLDYSMGNNLLLREKYNSISNRIELTEKIDMQILSIEKYIREQTNEYDYLLHTYSFVSINFAKEQSIIFKSNDKGGRYFLSRLKNLCCTSSEREQDDELQPKDLGKVSPNINQSFLAIASGIQDNNMIQSTFNDRMGYIDNNFVKEYHLENVGGEIGEGVGSIIVAIIGAL